MGYSEEHEKQKSKNYTVLALIAVFALIVFAVTLIKMKTAGGG